MYNDSEGLDGEDTMRSDDIREVGDVENWRRVRGTWNLVTRKFHILKFEYL